MKNIHSYCLTIAKLLVLAVLVSAACTKRQVMAASNNIPPAGTPATGGAKTYLALGDSYTIGQSVPSSDRYPVQAVVSLRQQGINMNDAEIIAVTGWTTNDLWNAVKMKPLSPTYDIVSLLIGVNNQYQGRSLSEYKTEFTTLLRRSIELAGNKADHVVVISIPDYSVTPYAASSDRAKIAAEIDAFNDANKTIADSFRVKYIDVTPESRKAANDISLIAGDGLHFSGKEYSIWTSMLVPVMKQAL